MSESSVVLLPYEPTSVAAARGHLSADLREAGIGTQAIGDAALVLSELLSNALIHAKPLPGEQLEVSWELSRGSVEVTVSDGGGTTRPQPAYPSLSSLGGRGLAIVQHLASRWGVRTDDTGTTVWAVVPAPGRNEAAGQNGRRGGPPGQGRPYRVPIPARTRCRPA